MFDAFVDIRNMPAVLRSIERRAQLIQFAQPAHRLFLQVVVDKIAGGPPQPDVDDQIHHHGAQHEQRQQATHETAFPYPANRLQKFIQTGRTRKTESADGVPFKGHGPILAAFREASGSDAWP